MKILLTGATGFVSNAVARTLRRHGHDVLALVRDPARCKDLTALGIELAVGDMWRPETYGPLVARVDAVIHAAQAKPVGRWSGWKIRAMHDSDALMTRTLASACHDQKKLFIYSSGALSHLGKDDDWIDEKTPLRPCYLGKGHADMVAELSILHKDRGLRVQFISPGFVYGAGGLLKDTVDLLKRGRYRIMGSGDNYWSMVYVDDVAQVYALAIERGKDGANYFVADDLPLRRREVVNRITDALGLPRVGHIPRWLVGLMYGFAMVEAVNSSIRMRNQFTKDQLGWRPRYATFDDGLPGALRELQGTR